MDKSILNSIDLKPNEIQLQWDNLREWILDYSLPELFSDLTRLKVFTSNFFEYFNEYNILKSCTEDEYKAVLYYLAISNGEKGQKLQGEELKMVIRILSKIKNS